MRTQSAERALIAKREKLRYSYNPKSARLLFVAESPPSSGGFFYNRFGRVTYSGFLCSRFVMVKYSGFLCGRFVRVKYGGFLCSRFVRARYGVFLHGRFVRVVYDGSR